MYVKPPLQGTISAFAAHKHTATQFTLGTETQTRPENHGVEHADGTRPWPAVSRSTIFRPPSGDNSSPADADGGLSSRDGPRSEHQSREATNQMNAQSAEWRQQSRDAGMVFKPLPGCLKAGLFTAGSTVGRRPSVHARLKQGEVCSGHFHALFFSGALTEIGHRV